MMWVYVAVQAHAQECRARVPIVTSVDKLRAAGKADSNARFVRLQPMMPELVQDIRYASSNNFAQRQLYVQHEAWLRLAPARALQKVQAELKQYGYALKLYDAYRPYSVSCTMWYLTPNKRYVANPVRGSHHNRGLAVDITLIDMKTGAELDMGTGYDNFTDSAHHAFKHLPAAVLKRRSVLKQIMWKHGFNYVPNEWWHYHWRNKNFDVVDIAFGDMKTL